MKKRILIPILFLCFTRIIGLAGCSSGYVAPPDIVEAWEPLAEIELLSPVSCEGNRRLFAYDKEASLDVKEVRQRWIAWMWPIDRFVT